MGWPLSITIPPGPVCASRPGVKVIATAPQAHLRSCVL
jgi:hypothetical protein